MEHPDLLDNIKEENADIEIKQEEVSFELIEEEEESCLIDEIKEETILNNEIKKENDEKKNTDETFQSKMMEFINVKAGEEIDNVWTEHPGHEADPLVLIPAIEIVKFESCCSEEELTSTTNVCTSTSQGIGGKDQKPLAIVTHTTTPQKNEQTDTIEPVFSNTVLSFDDGDSLPYSPSELPELFEENNSEYLPSSQSENEYSNREDESWVTTFLENVKLKKMTTYRKLNEPKLIKDSKYKGSFVGIDKVKKDENGRIERSKKHSCLYCHKNLVLLPRHLEAVHGKEIDVARLLAMPKNLSIRRNGFIELSRIGDYYHNCEVLSKKSGNLILVRRPSPHEEFSYKQYSPCPYCLGFMIQKHLWHHVKYGCSSRKAPKNVQSSDKEHNSVLVASKVLLAGSLNANIPDVFVDKVLSHMREDDISETVKNDDLILRFGMLNFEKYGLSQIKLILQMMRQLGRLTIALKDEEITTGDKTNLSKWLHPSNFDGIINGVKKVCLEDNQYSLSVRSEFKIPSLALKLGYHLKKCIGIERGRALRKCNRQRNEELKDLLNLIEFKWGVKISSNALATLNNRCLNKTKLLPVTLDLVELNEYLTEEVRKVKGDKFIEFNWRRLAELTLCKVVLFNKRQSGEASKLKIETYRSRSNWTNQTSDDSKLYMTELEKKLSSRLGLIEVIGNKGRKVPVLLTSDMKENIELLIKKREEAGVLKENGYIFAQIGGSMGHLRAHDCLRKYSLEAEIVHPQLITSTNLRKYVATVIQMFSLTENETDWMARHLGHDIRVHREFYRTHESVVETTKISRILLAVEQGKKHLFKGKKLEEINVDILDYTDESESEGNNSSDDEREVTDKTQQGSCGDIQHKNKSSGKLGESNERPAIFNTREKKRQKKRKLCSNEENSDHDHTESEDKDLLNDTPFSQDDPANRKRQKVTKEKRPWTNEEKKVVLNFYRNKIIKSIVPKKNDAEKCLKENHKVLCSRDWKDVKNCVHNYISKINKNKQIP